MSKSITFTKPNNVFELLPKKWRSLKAYFLRKQKSLKRFSLVSFYVWLQKYNPSQLAYFAAVFYLLIVFIFFSLNEGDILVAGFVAFLGLFREMWRMFQGIWQHNIGKAIILIVYAGTTNFALAFAALKINQITGTEPTPFVFTLGFTTLVMLPFWIMISNIFFLLLGLILANLLLFVSIPFKLVGIQLPVHWEDKHRAGTTMLFRILLIPIVIYSLAKLTAPYFNQMQLGDGQMSVKLNVDELREVVEENAFVIDARQESKLAAEIVDNIEQESAMPSNDFNDAIEEVKTVFADLQNAEQQSEEEIQTPSNSSSDETVAISEASTQDSSEFIHRLIAGFIFNFESYKYSACQKKAEQHSVIIDEDTVLLITPDEEAQYGYRYQVQACVPVYESQ